MSAVACILDRRGATISPRRIERLGDTLTAYGEISSVLCAGPVGIVVRHRADARARERFGPIRDDQSGRVVAVAGRFSEVGERDRPPTSAGSPAELGCARWVLQRWQRVGSGWLDEVAGSFTVVVADPGAGWLCVLRDHLGDLKVSYHLDGRRLIAATEAAAVVGDESVSAVPDERSAARFLGFRFGHSEGSFFSDVRELAPAHCLRVSGSDSTIERAWRFRRGQHASSPEEDRAVLIDHLDRAVRHHLEGVRPEKVALSLSGGLDSTAIAALAPRGIRAYSWRFEATPDPAEIRNIEAVARHLDLPVRWIDGDAHVPLSGDFRSRFVHESSPYVNAFAGLKRRLYTAAREDGCRRMMVGDGGDVLYGAADLWLRDALLSGRPWAFSTLAATVSRALRGDIASRNALRRIVPVRRSQLPFLARGEPRWMTAEGRALLPSEDLSPILPDGRFGRRYDLSVGARSIELESEERRLFFACGVERANPFWRWPLFEAVLRLPAFRLARGGRDKMLTRRALEGRLPRRVLESPRVGLLDRFFLRGIEENRRMVEESVFDRPRSDWQRYVRREWLAPHLAATGSICFGHTILWRVISYELWCRRVWGD
jgi:asparagine synthase (glutamine-hydrolysing)